MKSGMSMLRALRWKNRLVVPGRQGGVSLVIALLMLVAVAMLGISAAQISMQSEKASRNDRDRQIAFQAAEAAVMDAEMDIENSTGPKSRSAQFAPNSRAGFTPGCGAGLSNAHLGLCELSPEGVAPVWLTTDFQADDSDVRSVPYGHFTGQTFQTEKGTLPVKPPRYIIEVLHYTRAGEDATNPTMFYRITAVGFGMRETTQVALQTFYRKDD